MSTEVEKRRKEHELGQRHSEQVWIGSNGENGQSELNGEDKRKLIMHQVMTNVSTEINVRHNTEDIVCCFSRQILWESKRVIAGVLGNLRDKNGLERLRNQLIYIVKNDKLMAGMIKEMYTMENLYYYYRLYSPCLQEFVEAYTLLTLVQHDRLATYKEVYELLRVKQIFSPGDTNYEKVVLEKNNGVKDDKVTVHTQIPITKTDFYLGLADVPGELVRACMDETDKSEYFKNALKICAVVRSLHQCFSRIFPLSYHMKSKVRVMYQSLLKLENICYEKVIKRRSYFALKDGAQALLE